MFVIQSKQKKGYHQINDDIPLIINRHTAFNSDASNVNYHKLRHQDNVPISIMKLIRYISP